MNALLSTAVAALMLSGLAGGVIAPATANAAPPAQQRQQVPGYYRMALGAFEVTALYDGFIDLDSKLLVGVAAKDLQELTARMFIPNPSAVQTTVNAYLVHTGTNLVLVDTGTAKVFGPTLGAILDNIRAAGYDPAQIDTVLLTHLHPDHASGLLTPQGAIAFPNAVVRASTTEADHWLSESIAAAAPKEAQTFFKMARDAVAPYAAQARFKPFAAGEALLPGLSVLPSPGHTPGHTSFLFSSGESSLLVWGDIIHNHAVQFPRPDVAIEFDTDTAQAIASRRTLLADAAGRKLLVAGAHLPFPGIGHIRQEPAGYAWVPVEYGPLR